MAVELTQTSKSFTGTGTLSIYATLIYASTADQMKVFVNGVMQTLGDNYTVAGLRSPGGVSIQATFPLGSTVYVERMTPLTQLVDTVDNETILADVLDAEFDKLTMQMQERAGETARAVLVPRGEAGPVLPSILNRALRIFGWSSSGSAIAYTATELANFILAPLTTLLPASLKGNTGAPGGNLGAIGAKTAANGIVLPAGVTLISTSCYSVPGDRGNGDYQLVGADDATIPASGKIIDSLGRMFRLICPGGIIYIEQVGGRANGASVSWTDNLQPILDAMAMVDQPLNDDSSSITFPSRFSGQVRLGLGAYKYSDVFEQRRTVRIQGLCGAETGTFSQLGPTRWLFPKNKGAIIVHNFDTRGRGARAEGDFTLGGATGSVIDGIAFVGYGTSSDLTQHAIQLRTFATVEHCQFDNVAGDHVHIEGYTNGAGIYGNVNGWVVRYNYFGAAGGNALAVMGSDANAGQEEGNNYHGPFGGCAILCTAYYANTFRPGNISGYGNGGVYYGGKLWMLVSPFGNGGTVVPGTDLSVWYPIYEPATSNPGSPFPDWTMGGTYVLKQPIFDNGSGSEYIAPYVEVSTVPAYVVGASLVIAGTIGVVGNHLRTFPPHGPFLESQQGIAGGKSLVPSDVGYADYGSYYYNALGTTEGGVRYLRLWRAVAAGADASWGERVVNGNVDYGWGGITIWWHTGTQFGPAGDTQSRLGRTVRQYNTFCVPQLAIGSGTAAGRGGEHRIHAHDTAAPGGEAAQGEVRYMLNPSAASPVTVRVCYAGGNPGSWRAAGALAFKGNTASRPVLGAEDVGVMHLNTTLNANGKPTWWTGSAWVDATGAAV